MGKKLPVNDFKWVKDISELKISKKLNSDEGCPLEVDIQYPEKLHYFHIYLPFLPERMKIEKIVKLISNLHDKTKCYSHKKFNTSIKSEKNFEKSS